MRSDRSPTEIDRLRDEVRELARDNAELRTLVQQQLAGSGRLQGVESGKPGARLAPVERERRMRVFRRLTFTLVLLALGIVALILAAGPPSGGSGAAGRSTAAPTSGVAPVPTPAPVPPVPEPTPAPEPTPVPAP